MFKELCGYMKVPSLKGCFHLVLAVLQGIFQSRNCFIFLHIMRNLIFGTSPAAVFRLFGEQLATSVQFVLTGYLCFLILFHAKQ